eukprot:TRINITY_DN1993_c1_g1_i1.p1 TRINITY_DN1993_c1_g1~~TRINITY_DN1993_c1_g1_i1.p1  ORF type:complete len:200 (+),score=36.97 TRINITY_DN1993_c1_g1_i1:67-666(+)
MNQPHLDIISGIKNTSVYLELLLGALETFLSGEKVDIDASLESVIELTALPLLGENVLSATFVQKGAPLDAIVTISVRQLGLLVFLGSSLSPHKPDFLQMGGHDSHDNHGHDNHGHDDHHHDTFPVWRQRTPEEYQKTQLPYRYRDNCVEWSSLLNECRRQNVFTQKWKCSELNHGFETCIYVDLLSRKKSLEGTQKKF